MTRHGRDNQYTLTTDDELHRPRVGHTNERRTHYNSQYDDGYLSTKESDSTKQVIAVSRNHNRHIGQHRGRHEQSGYRRKERHLSSSCDRSRYSRYSDECSSEEDANSDRCRMSRQHKHRSVDESTEKRGSCYNVAEESRYRKPEHRDRDLLKSSRSAMGGSRQRTHHRDSDTSDSGDDRDNNNYEQPSPARMSFRTREKRSSSTSDDETKNVSKCRQRRRSRGRHERSTPRGNTHRLHCRRHRSTEDRRISRAEPTTRGRKHPIKPDRYDGKTCIETYLSKFESISDYNEWNLKDKAAHLKASLVDGAATLLWQSKESSYQEIVAKLRARYGSAGQGEKFRLQLRCRRRRSGESPPEFAQEVERLTALAYPEAGLEMRDLLAGDVFIENLDNLGLTFKVREREPATLRDAVTTVIKSWRAEINKKTSSQNSQEQLKRQQ